MESNQSFYNSWMRRFGTLKKYVIVLLLLGNAGIGISLLFSSFSLASPIFLGTAFILLDYLWKSSRKWDSPAVKLERRWKQRDLDS